MPLGVTALVAAVCATAGTATASEKSAAQQAAALTPSVNLMIAILLRLGSSYKGSRVAGEGRPDARISKCCPRPDMHAMP